MASSYFKSSLVLVPIITNFLIFSLALHTDNNEDNSPSSLKNVIKTDVNKGPTLEISDIDLPSNSSLNSTSLQSMEKRRADAEWLKDVRMAIEGVTQLIVGVIGLVGNGLSIAVLYRQDMDLKPVFKQILITLISFDTFCIVFNLLLFCFSHLSIYYYDNIFPYIVPYILPLAQIALTGSIYSTLAVAIERYTSVCHPHYTPSHCAGSFSISALVIFSIAFNVCRFLEFETTYMTEIHCFDVDMPIKCPEPILDNKNSTVLSTNSSVRMENVTRAIPSPTAIRQDPLYSQVTLITMLIVGGVIPLVVLIALNTKIYLAIRERTQRLATMTSRQRRDLAAATVLVGIILVFIVCHSFKFVVNIYEAYLAHVGKDAEKDWAVWMDGVVSFSHLLSTVNSSLNFVIYCYKDEKFRHVLLRMTCPDWQMRRSINSRRTNNHCTAMTTVAKGGTKAPLANNI